MEPAIFVADDDVVGPFGCGGDEQAQARGVGWDAKREFGEVGLAGNQGRGQRRTGGEFRRIGGAAGVNQLHGAR